MKVISLHVLEAATEATEEAPVGPLTITKRRAMASALCSNAHNETKSENGPAPMPVMVSELSMCKDSNKWQQY